MNFVNGMKDIIPKKNDTQYQRLLAIGDIHGCFDKLMSLLEKISVTDDDLLIALGDVVDRGNKVGETLTWIMEQSKKKNFIFLAGNHELMMLNAFKRDRVFLDKIFSRKKKILTYRDLQEHEAASLWILNGGDKTINALLKLQRSNKFIVDEVLDLIKNFSLSHTIEICGRNYFFCHAGVRPGIPLEEQTALDLLWIRKEFFHRTEGYNGKDVIIVGHTPTQRLSRRDKDGALMMTTDDTFLVDYMSPEKIFDNNKPFKMPNRNLIMLDTGSWRSSISCINILSGEYWQSNK